MPLQNRVTPSYEIWLGSKVGERYITLNSRLLSLNITLTLNGYSVVNLELTGENLADELILEDGWLEIWRGTNESDKRLLSGSPFLLVSDRRRLDGGQELVSLTGWSAPRIFNWPVVAYAANNAYTVKTDYADDMIKAIARENVGSLATDTDRDMTDYLTIQADTSAGASLTKGFARRELSVIFSELCAASAQQGTRLYWDVVLKNPNIISGDRLLELRTYTGQRGSYRGLTSTAPFTFSTDQGNLENVIRERDYSDVVNYAYGLGQGTESSRNVQTASDTTRAAALPWGRIKEGTRQATAATSDAGVTAEAQALIRENRPRLIISGDIKDTPSSQLGVHYDHGDLVIVEAFGTKYEATVSPIQIRFSGSEETITGRLRVET